MPRSFQLTWQAGTDRRPGRWRKKYRGKVYYFAGGRGKYDRVAYDAAVAAWEAQKTVVDAGAPRQYQLKYEEAIGTWESALAWSTRHGDREMEAIAFETVTRLRKLLEQPVLEPLARSDLFHNQFVPNLADVVVAPTADDVRALDSGTLRLPCETPTAARRAAIAAEMDGTPMRILREKWLDRAKSVERCAGAPDETIGAHAELFLKLKEQNTEVGELTLGRYFAIQLHVNHFRDWLGGDTSVREIDGTTLLRYHSHLLDGVKSGKWGRTNAKNYLSTVKSFIRWLWQTDKIAALPRVIDGRSKLLKISAAAAEITVFDKSELAMLLTNASDRTKLYILLMLNCGMTQKDIADLRQPEVDWNRGRIRRRRSKTASHKDVPIVDYLLWPETFRLLRQERADAKSERVLVNLNGSPIWSESIGAERKYKKSDNVKNAFDRLRTSLGIKKPLKSLKKTSATLLRGNEKYHGLEGLFLGHAPQSMADKHYTLIPQTLLDQAIQWLAQELGINACAIAEPQTAGSS